MLFLVRDAGRADSINRALSEWSAQHPRRWNLPRALTMPDAVREILAALGQGSSELESASDAKTAAGTLLPEREIKLLCEFFDETVTTLKKAREAARERKEVPPPYPTTSDEVRRLLLKLRRNIRRG